MTRSAGVLTALVLLVACSRAPRSEDYFEAHPSEAQSVLARCKAGRTRGEECQTALAGAKDAADKARLELYRKSF